MPPTCQASTRTSVPGPSVAWGTVPSLPSSSGLACVVVPTASSGWTAEPAEAGGQGPGPPPPDGTGAGGSASKDSSAASSQPVWLFQSETSRHAVP